MQRYTVTIVSHGTTGTRPQLLVPFQSTAIVTAFIDELYKRVERQGLAIAPNTHIATLHLDSETGAIIDCEDVLSDVISDPKSEKLFAVFAKKAQVAAPPTDGQATARTTTSGDKGDVPALSFRVVTPSTTKDRDACPVLSIPLSATIRQLHERIALKLEIPTKFDENADNLECNCKLANLLIDDDNTPNQLLVVHAKSAVERLQLENPTDAVVRQAVRKRFGQDFELTKRLALVGGDVHLNDPTLYKKTPVEAICSRQRHTPVHARVDIDETGHRRSKVLDLHTSELPINPASMEATIEEAGLHSLLVDGAIDIFAVSRTTTGQNAAAIGKSSIYRARAHWEPSVTQSDRGMAMFLSSLRVFVSLVQDMRNDERSQDAVLHAFDLIVNFTPALRALHILIQGKTPTAVESAALSQAMFEVMKSFVPTEIVGSDHSRVFEGARLLFGFILDKARSLKLAEDESADLPYLASLQTVDLRDYRTGEAVMRAVNTSKGLVEASLFNSFEAGSVLASSHLQTFMVRSDIDASIFRQALLSGGSASEITAFSLSNLLSNYRYRDSGDVNVAIDLGELSELNHLAELCGRNKLAVHKPSQLSSAVAPCLTFDRNAHLAVYTGEQPCGEPGHSSILFRPQHGDQTIDAAVIEQLIAPLLQGYESDGSAVFDALGGAAVRRLQAPDEILMFCVDCSASMRSATDFDEVNDPSPIASDDPDAHSLVEVEFYNTASFDDMKERVCSYEGFDDILAIIAEVEGYYRRTTASQVVDILRTLLSSSIVQKSENLTNRRQYSRNWHYARREISGLEEELNKLKGFWAASRHMRLPFVIF